MDERTHARVRMPVGTYGRTFETGFIRPTLSNSWPNKPANINSGIRVTLPQMWGLEHQTKILSCTAQRWRTLLLVLVFQQEWEEGYLCKMIVAYKQNTSIKQTTNESPGYPTYTNTM